MARTVNLSIRVNTNDAQILAVEIDDDDWDVLVRFTENFERLAATRMGRAAHVSIEFTFDVRTGVSWTGTLPPEDEIAAFLHRLRPFLLNDEASNFNRMCNRLGCLIPHPGNVAFLRQQRREFSGRGFQDQVRFLSNDTVVNSEAVLQDWLNAYEYHQDPERRDQLSKVHHHLMPLEALRPLFVSMLIDKARAIAALADLVRLLLGGSKGHEIRFGGLSIDHGKTPVGSSPSPGETARATRIAEDSKVPDAQD